jgi:ADP-ribose pyrophosphatase
MTQPRIVKKESRVLSGWAELVTRLVEVPGNGPAQEYHSFALDDYVNVLAVTRDGEIPLVRQYRPALEGYSLELPGGLPDSGEKPAGTANRELYEETGYRADEEPIFLACLHPDSGRLENRLWCYFAPEVKQRSPQDWQPEPGVELIIMSKMELRQAISSGEFVHALHIAIIGLALIHGHFQFDD